MNQLKVFSLFVLINVALASPLFPREENLINGGANHRWNLIPDSEGRMHLMDLNPFDAPVEPAFNPVTDTIFLLRTRRNPTVSQPITGTPESIANSFFDRDHPTRFTIHGWNGDATARVNTLVASEYHFNGEFNMVTVDWCLGGCTLNYITARNRVVDVANVVAEFIVYLRAIGHVRLPDLHVIGHSLGGQMAGVIAKEVTRLTGGGLIQVITALDPAGPLFSMANPEGRVTPTDGVYVESIFTNFGRLGFDQPLAQADFYPNFGIVMPGCESDLTGQCSHSRSHLYYAESINRRFSATECSSFNDIVNGHCTPTGRSGVMGGPHGHPGQTGIFHLTTNADSPFSQG